MTNTAIENRLELSPEDLNKVMATVDIPSCPGMVTEAMKEAQKDEPDIRRLSNIILNDPAMSATALKLVNSPLFGASTKISSVSQAVMRLGTRNIVNVVVASALRASFSGLPVAWLEQFWRRIGLLALCASMIARRLYGISPDSAYTYTLFHDAAIPLMMKRFPNYTEVLEQSRRDGILLAHAEGDFFPCTHPIVGSLLVRNWGLPPNLGLAIRLHHEPDVYELPDSTLPGNALSLIAVTQVAEFLLSEIRQGEERETTPELFAKAIEYLGISVDDVDDLRQLVADAVNDAQQA